MTSDENTDLIPVPGKSRYPEISNSVCPFHLGMRNTHAINSKFTSVGPPLCRRHVHRHRFVLFLRPTPTLPNNAIEGEGGSCTIVCSRHASMGAGPRPHSSHSQHSPCGVGTARAVLCLAPDCAEVAVSTVARLLAATQQRRGPTLMAPVLKCSSWYRVSNVTKTGHECGRPLQYGVDAFQQDVTRPTPRRTRKTRNAGAANALVSPSAGMASLGR